MSELREAAKWRRVADVLAGELARWGWGDHHYGDQPQATSVQAALAVYDEAAVSALRDELVMAALNAPCVLPPDNEWRQHNAGDKPHPDCAVAAVLDVLRTTLLADVERHLWAAVLGEETDDAWRSEAAALVSRLRAVGGRGEG